jgi:steroid delta-isomerase-like uncharacterized protein
MNAQETIDRQLKAMNAHEAKAFAACYAAAGAVVDPFYPEPIKGRDAIEKDIADFFTALPDVHAQLGKLIVNSDTVAYEGKVSGTHLGPMQGPTGLIPATNRKLEFTFGIFTRLDANGAIVEEHRYLDVAGIMGQLGLV